MVCVCGSITIRHHRSTSGICNPCRQYSLFHLSSKTSICSVNEWSKHDIQLKTVSFFYRVNIFVPTTSQPSPYRIDIRQRCLCRINPIAPLRTHRRHCSMALPQHQYHRHHRHLLKNTARLINSDLEDDNKTPISLAIYRLCTVTYLFQYRLRHHYPNYRRWHRCLPRRWCRSYRPIVSALLSSVLNYFGAQRLCVAAVRRRPARAVATLSMLWWA